MKLKHVLGSYAIATGLLFYPVIVSSQDKNINFVSSAPSQVTYSERPALTREEYEERRLSLENLSKAFVKASKKDPRPSANIEELAVELIGNPLTTKPPSKYGYGLMTPAKNYVIFPRHILMLMDLYIRKALEGDSFSTNNLSKNIFVYNLDKSHKDLFNFLRDHLNVRDKRGNVYPSNPHTYCSVPSLDVIVTKVESPKNASAFKISIKKTKVGDRLNFFNIGGRDNGYLSQATVTVIDNSKSARLRYSEENPSPIIFDAFVMDVRGYKGLSGSTLSKKEKLFGMVIGTMSPSNKSQNGARHMHSTKPLQNHELVATSAKNIAKAVRWCAEKGLKELDSANIID